MSARLFVYIRFGEWDKALSVPEPPDGELFSTSMWQYARGIAFVGKRDFDAASEALAGLNQAIDDDDVMNENVTRIAAHALAGELAAKQGKIDEAVEHLETAVELQDGLRYTEPPPWHYPVRQSLGAVLLEAGRAAEAEVVYRKDIEVQRDSGWGLFGLLQAYGRKARWTRRPPSSDASRRCGRKPT